MPRLRLIGRGSALYDVILLVALMSLGAVFLTRYAEMTRRNSRDYPVALMTLSDEDIPGKSPPYDHAGSDVDLSQLTIDELLRRVPDRRPAICRRRRYQQLPVATVVVVFSDYEFYDARVTLTSILRDTTELSQLITEILLIDDASSREQVLRDTQNYIRSVSTSLPVVRLVRLGRRVGRVRARLLAANEHVTNDVVVFVDAGVVCSPGWISPLLELVSSAADGQTTVAVPHYDQLVHPVTLKYLHTDSDVVATLSWSLTIRMRHQDVSAAADSMEDAGLSRSVTVLRGDVFAVRRTFLSSIGGLYDVRLEHGTGVAEHVELSLRTWLCGGTIKVCVVLAHR